MQVNDPDCTCTNVEPRHESIIVPGGGSRYALYLDFVEDESIIDPDCYYHGDNGTMVLTITYPKQGGTSVSAEHDEPRASE